jgi:gliding motility-associated protein GldE
MMVCLAVSAICSSSENAFFSHRESDLDEYSENGTKSQRRILKLISNPKRLLATILLLNSLANIAFIISSLFFYDLILNNDDYPLLKLIIDTLFVTLIILIFGEVMPKVYATKNYRKTAEWLSLPMHSFVWFLWPFTTLLERLGMVLERNTKSNSPNVTTEEINQAIDLATNEVNGDTDHEKEILKGIVNFGTLSVKQVMQSRMDITAIEIDMDFHELMDKINKSGYSRIPVFRETIDNVEGILYIKDLLPHIDQDENFEWHALIRKGFFVPENKKVDTLMKDFQKKRVHMAIVVDEYGGTSGLVTLEDLIEEIIGEINDEFDDIEDYYFKEIDPSTFIFEGKISLNDFCKKLELDQQLFDEVKGESESLGGLLLEINSSFPKNGTKINFDQFEFTILAVDAKRIKKVKVRIIGNEKENGGHNVD